MEALFWLAIAIVVVVVIIRILISLLAFFFRLLLGFVALLVLLAILLAMSASPAQCAPVAPYVECDVVGATEAQSCKGPSKGWETDVTQDLQQPSDTAIRWLRESTSIDCRGGGADGGMCGIAQAAGSCSWEGSSDVLEGHGATG